MIWWELYQKADKIQAKILKKAKIIQSESEFKQYTVHRIGHPLGWDCSICIYQDDKLLHGTVVTIEPVSMSKSSPDFRFWLLSS